MPEKYNYPWKVHQPLLRLYQGFNKLPNPNLREIEPDLMKYDQTNKHKADIILLYVRLLLYVFIPFVCNKPVD